MLLQREKKTKNRSDTLFSEWKCFLFSFERNLMLMFMCSDSVKGLEDYHFCSDPIRPVGAASWPQRLLVWKKPNELQNSSSSAAVKESESRCCVWCIRTYLISPVCCLRLAGVKASRQLSHKLVYPVHVARSTLASAVRPAEAWPSLMRQLSPALSGYLTY